MAANLVLTLAVPRPARAATFSDDFSAGLRPTWWSIIQTTSNFYSVDASQGNVRLAKTSAHNPGGVQFVFVRVNLSLLGGAITSDFSTQIDFAGAVVPGPGLDQVELHTYYQDGSIYYTVYDRSSGFNAHVWDGGSVQGVLPVGGDSGTFRISRTGSTVTGYFNGSPLFSETRASALTAIDFVLQNNLGSDDPISVTFDNFSLTAPSVPPTLGITRSNTALIVSWPVPAEGWLLHATTNLVGGGSVWTEIPPPYPTNGTNLQFTEPSPVGHKFYRLHQP